MIIGARHTWAATKSLAGSVRWLAPWLVLAGVVLTGGSVLIVRGAWPHVTERGGSLRDPVYDVAIVREYLANDAPRWEGRMILIRGMVVPCMPIVSEGDEPCAALAPGPGQQPAPGRRLPAIDPLPLVHVGSPPLVALLRRLPILGGLSPAPQVLRWGAIAIYRVRLHAIPTSICGAGVCYEGLLLDTAA
jgi:hypothetical protein